MKKQRFTKGCPIYDPKIKRWSMEKCMKTKCDKRKRCVLFEDFGFMNEAMNDIQKELGMTFKDILKGE